MASVLAVCPRLARVPFGAAHALAVTAVRQNSVSPRVSSSLHSRVYVALVAAEMSFVYPGVLSVYFVRRSSNPVSKPVSVLVQLRVNGVLSEFRRRRGELHEISRVLPVLRDHDIRADAHLYNALMKANVAADDPRAVLRVFRQMRSDDVDRDLVTYNTLIFGLARARMVAKARAFLDDMAAEGHLPNVVTYTSLMNRMCVKGDALGALKLLEEMQGKGSILVIAIVGYRN
ncbi:pentatricopeptide repeat-containing protein At2g17670 [Zea mays]|uniref:pentatricopeptide repeat-containing protein At2g17670 n=1 Tax=Zea mays TaxID=4577 RepID=UPI000C6C53B9|nr:pentatricopeptide repeat-containing protein At2g17670 [Zea mays]|eukprot:XP_023156955.1 pentatricopeptide repeat-containing protein At2g17670-like [Zea mays]